MEQRKNLINKLLTYWRKYIVINIFFKYISFYFRKLFYKQPRGIFFFSKFSFVYLLRKQIISTFCGYTFFKFYFAELAFLWFMLYLFFDEVYFNFLSFVHCISFRFCIFFFLFFQIFILFFNKFVLIFSVFFATTTKYS